MAREQVDASHGAAAQHSQIALPVEDRLSMVVLPLALGHRA
jgi:hypothetical protein